jgi:putative ATPase
MQESRSTSLFPEMTEVSSMNAASSTSAPLADRMRPRTLDEFVGQEQLVGEGRVLRRLIEGGTGLPSLILWGPPGTGKTTLARLLAERSDARFVALSAVFSGVKELRGAIAEARLNRQRGQRTILFIDESIASIKRNRTLCCRQSKMEP